MNIWTKIASLILRNKIIFIILIILTTALFITQWKNVKISYTTKSILPDDDPYAIEFAKFKSKFRNENNIILIGVNDKNLFTKEKFNAWSTLSDNFEKLPEVEKVISLKNLQLLVNDTVNKKFILKNLINSDIKTDKEAQNLKTKLSDSLPFYEGIIFNKNSGALQTIVVLKKEIATSKKRIGFAINTVKPMLDDFQKKNHLKVHTSGLLYIKALNAKVLEKELPLFIVLSLL
jgi:predicted RND superfamily exporter protein